MIQLLESYEGDKWASEMIAEAAVLKGGPKEFELSQGLLKIRGRWYIGSNGGLRRLVYEELHEKGVGGHSGTRATIKRVGQYFFWKTMQQDIGKWIRECAVCQASKSEHVPTSGLLQPLPIPDEPWRDIAMDFITGLPNSRGYEVIWVITDRFSRYTHFLTLSHPLSAKNLALIFFDHIYKLHGVPSSIVSDRDSLFISEFWQTLFKLVGTRLNLSTAYHPQSDGSTERINQCLEQYLRCMTSQAPKKWSTWLPAAEWWFNTTYHTTLKCTPYKTFYGVEPTHLSISKQQGTNLAAVDDIIKEKKQQLEVVKEQLERAQQRMKAYADKKRSERVFTVGDMVYLKLQPYRQGSASMRKNAKLAPKFFGPYKVLEKVGQVAYKLELPATSRIHPTFHVSQLKKSIGNCMAREYLPQVTSDGTFDLGPLRILDQRKVLKKNQEVFQYLIQWKGCSVDEATWEDENLLKINFPDFSLDP